MSWMMLLYPEKDPLKVSCHYKKGGQDGGYLEDVEGF